MPHVHEVGEAFSRSVGNEHKPARYRANYGDVKSPWVNVKHWRCERLSSAYSSLPRQRRVGAAPHRGNTCAARRIADASETGEKPFTSPYTHHQSATPHR
ncbi:hypothetical protein BN2476_740008 [Paraburkholderia piptadeniae]|uniref:Uncharacterized protein n=1 Tax=Paraburkholderia piptadeniae TaxID=1701573 RepID=A0A1N7SR89_9BURK|nr:hypothetical protein BN2476_740008 [Paraburkholderia piptadeniae]